MTFMAITYAGLIAVMPRAGGDYVWQTRIMDGIPGAVLGAAFGFVAVFLVGTALALGDLTTYGGGVLGGVGEILIPQWKTGRDAARDIFNRQVRAYREQLGPSPARQSDE
jgi:amino acid transporter